MDVFWIIFLAMIGACIGSFLNVVIYRLPRGKSIVFPPSHCPSCGRAIKWYDNIPMASWLALRGKCRFCKTSISPRYLVVEAATALLVTGLYVCYFMLHLRRDAGPWQQSWPMFIAHATLLCSLLVCSFVDVERWIVPLEVCWFASAVGLVCSAASPHPWVPRVAPATGAMAIAAAAGLAVSLVAVRYGWIQRSFIDADEKPPAEPEPPQNTSKKSRKKQKPPAVAMTKQHGVNPRKEVLREVLYLAPAFGLAIVAWLLVTKVPAAANAWAALTGSGKFARHFNALLAALFGYLIGGLWIWGARIFGTLAFGKEAMGLGDVHILAAVGAVTGWIVPSVAFFVAPLFGLVWALYLWLAKDQRELPYGPWLAAGAIMVMLFYDVFEKLLKPYTETFEFFFQG